MIVILWIQIKIICIKQCQNKKLQFIVNIKILLFYKLDTVLKVSVAYPKVLIRIRVRHRYLTQIEVSVHHKFLYVY